MTHDGDWKPTEHAEGNCEGAMVTRAFRLFVSSTFQDFGEERDLLQVVFRDLESSCEVRGYGFRAVDLRWGVNDDAQLNQRTAEICLEEVRAAKGYPPPSLLVLLGDRHGTVALPFAIARDEFAAARDWLRSQGEDALVAELDRVYGRDDNHLIACGLRAPSGSPQTTTAYTLRSRHDDLADLANPKAWAEVEARIRDALQAAAQHLYGAGRLDDAGRDKYFLSLTELEIREGLTALALDATAATAHTIAWIRTTKAAEPKAGALAASLRRTLPKGNVLGPDVSPPAGSDHEQPYRDAFISRITVRLRAAIDAHIAAVEAQAQAFDFALRAERDAHDAFAAERLRVFVGRESNRTAIADYIAGDARHPLVLCGVSGSGKSALMARVATDAEAVASTKVVKRFVGASAASTDQRALLISLVEDLAALGVAQKPEQWEEDGNRFVGQVRDLIGAIDDPVVIFIDALDQIRSPYRPAWLPAELKPKVKLVVSVLDDEAFTAEREIVRDLQRRLPPETVLKAFLEIEPLSAADGADILAGLLGEAQRELQPRQRDFILERFIAAGASPLYLVIAFAIARRWRSTVDPHACSLAGDVTSLIGQFIDELGSVHHHEPLLIRRSLGLLAAGAEGLSESELIAVLSRDQAVMRAVSSERFGVRTARLPDSVWVRLKRSLSALLVEKGAHGEPLLQFFHRQAADVVRTRFYEPEHIALHQALAAFFDAPASAEGEVPIFGRRSLSELPYQLFRAKSRARLDALLTDAAWIDRKIEAFGGVAEIVADYDHFADPAQPLQGLIGRTLRLSAGIIARDPRQRMLQLHGRLIGAEESTAFVQSLLSRIADGALVETRAALMPPGRELARFEGQGGRITALAVLQDGRLASGAGDNTIRLWDPSSGRELARLEGQYWWSGGAAALTVLRDGRLASARDQSIRLWDPASGRELARLDGHTRGVNALAALPDGRLASGADDNIIRIWDPSSGRETARFEGHTRVRALVVLRDGRLASGAGASIRLWDLASGRETARLEGHRFEVTALAALPDGRLASGAGHDSIRLWDPSSGRETARLEQEDLVTTLAALPDSRLAIGSQFLDSIRLWDPASGRETARLEGHTGGVTALAALPDGRLASGSNDDTIRLWDPRAGRERAAGLGHASAVNAFAVLPDGRLATGSDDGTIRLWDSKLGRETARLERLEGSGVASLMLLPDGRLASGARDSSISLWDPAAERETARLEGYRHEDWAGGVQALALLPDGKLAAGLGDGTIKLWDVASECEIAQLTHDEGGVNALCVLPDGRLASGSGDRTIRLWDLTGGSEVARLRGHDGWVEALAMLPDGRLASGSLDGTIRLWDPTTGGETLCLSGYRGGVRALALLPGGWLAGGCQGIQSWDPRTGRETASLEFDGIVQAIIALPDGSLVAGDSFGRLHWLAIKGEEGPRSAP